MYSCKGCACVKAGSRCVNCLPIKLGKCQNYKSAPAPQVTTVPTSNTALLTTISDSSSSTINSNAMSQADSQPHYYPPNNLWISLGENTLGKPCSYNIINSSYDEVIHWKPNLFLVPYGSAGTSFVKELTCLFQSFAEGSCLERTSMKAITLFQILMLQKPSKRSKIKEHISHLQQRLDMWIKGDIAQLMDEGKHIQVQLTSRKAPRKNNIDGHIFRQLMAQGKVRSALNYLSRGCFMSRWCDTRDKWSDRSWRP